MRLDACSFHNTGRVPKRGETLTRKGDAAIWEGRPAGRRRPDQRGSLIDLYASIGSVFLEHYVDRLYHFLVLVSFAINNNLMLQVLRAFGL